MSESATLWIRVVCWTVAAGYTALTAAYLWFVTRIYQRPSVQFRGLFDANEITDPLGMILGIGAPLAFIAVGTLAVICRRKDKRKWSVTTGAVLCASCTAILVSFGWAFFQRCLPGHRFSDIV
ncbi:MAG: hypothetical protein EOP84_18935, partial [Verrucomicrobiaceae bacterium]